MHPTPDEISTMRSRHLDALHQQRAWVEHWIDDVAAGLKPTPESLSRSLAGIDAAIAAVEATPADDTARTTVEGIMAGHDAMVDALAGER